MPDPKVDSQSWAWFENMSNNYCNNCFLGSGQLWIEPGPSSVMGFSVGCELTFAQCVAWFEYNTVGAYWWVRIWSKIQNQQKSHKFILIYFSLIWLQFYALLKKHFLTLFSFCFLAMKSDFCIPSVLINTVLLLVSKDPTDSSPCEYIHQNLALQEEHSLLTGSQLVTYLIMVVHEKKFRFSQNFLSKVQLNFCLFFSQTNITNLYANQSELSALQTGCTRISRNVVSFVLHT